MMTPEQIALNGLLTALAAVRGFGYTSPVSQRKGLTGGDSPNGAVTSRNTCTSDCGVFSSEPNASARPYRARADSLVARTGEPQGSPVLHRSVNPVRAASHLTVGSAALQSETGARAMSQTLVTVDFHGQSLIAALIDGKPYVAMRPIVENIGLDWKSQYARINRNLVMSKGVVMMTIPSGGGDQETLCLPLDLLNGWLFGVDVNRVKAEIKPKLIRYQEECYRVLFQHFMPQQAQRPHNPAIDYDRISPAQAQDLKEIVNAIVKAGVQGHGETWARLHNKFRVNSYLELPATRHLEARQYLLAKLPKGDGGGDVVGQEPAVPTDAARMRIANEAANTVAAQVQAQVFSAMLSGCKGDDWRRQRWLVGFITDTRHTNAPATISAISPDAYIATIPGLAQGIRQGAGDKAELMELADAVTRRLFCEAASNPHQGFGAEVAKKIHDGMNWADLHAISVAANMETWLRTAKHKELAAS